MPLKSTCLVALLGLMVGACAAEPTEDAGSDQAAIEATTFDWNGVVKEVEGLPLSLKSQNAKYEPSSSGAMTPVYVAGKPIKTFALESFDVTGCRIYSPRAAPGSVVHPVDASGFLANKDGAEKDEVFATIEVFDHEGVTLSIACVKLLAKSSKAPRTITYQEIVDALWDKKTGAQVVFYGPDQRPRAPTATK